ncbi:MAG: prepilin-type N-terminal cleavage/methylation domain-containing protein [Acidimicrobiales bacterium]
MDARRLHGEAGVTLIESVVALAILGIAFAIFVGGMFTSVVGSDVHRKQATAETVLRSYAESLEQSGVTYVNCAGVTSYPAFSAPSGYTATITAVEYWNGSSYGAALPSPCSSDLGIQQLSLRVASTDNRDAEIVDIVKRKS